MILSSSLRFIKFLILCYPKIDNFIFRFLFYLTVLYLSVFLASDMSRVGSVFDVNVSCIVNDDISDFRSFLIFPNNSVHVDVHVNVNNYLNRKFYDFQSKLESNSFKLQILFLVFSLMFYHIFLKQSWIKDKNIWISYINFSAQYCVKSVHIRSYSGPHFPAFGLNAERYFVSLRIQFECGKVRTRITPNTNTFYAVPCNEILQPFRGLWRYKNL